MTTLRKALTSLVLGGAVCAMAIVAEPATPIAAQTGSITGTVTLEAQRPRRQARGGQRYTRGAAQRSQTLPAVVYILGTVPGAAASRARAHMIQRDSLFVPATLIVQAGSIVEFPNEDDYYHNVFSVGEFDLGRYPQGESKEVTLSEPGVISIACEVHERMRAAIVVTENPYHAVVAEDGSFSIPGVPPGEYDVRFWHPDYDLVERTLSVRSGGSTEVEVELTR